MNAQAIDTIRETLQEARGLARMLDQVKHHRGTYYQDKIARIDAARAWLAANRTPQE